MEARNTKSLPPHMLDIIKKAEKRDKERELEEMFTIKEIDPFTTNKKVN